MNGSWDAYLAVFYFLNNLGNKPNDFHSYSIHQSATCFVSSNGLKVTVEDAKCVQANAFVQSGIFQEFIFKEESATFRINLNVLLVKTLINCIFSESFRTNLPNLSSTF